MSEITIRKIGLNDVQLIEKFLTGAGSSLASFRYFDKRPLSIISNHVITGILMDGELPVGYCHLDKDGNTIWLGIAVAERARGKGYGNLLLDFLLEAAKKASIHHIKLTVDKDNDAAIGLYKKFDFITVKDMNERSILMELNIRN